MAMSALRSRYSGRSYPSVDSAIPMLAEVNTS